MMTLLDYLLSVDIRFTFAVIETTPPIKSLKNIKRSYSNFFRYCEVMDFLDKQVDFIRRVEDHMEIGLLL